MGHGVPPQMEDGMTNQPIFTDNGAAKGLRTRLFRNMTSGAGVEWTFAVDYAQSGQRCRWYGYGMSGNNSVERMMAEGFDLAPFEEVAP